MKTQQIKYNAFTKSIILFADKYKTTSLSLTSNLADLRGGKTVVMSLSLLE